jgi:hypothetical protein
MVRTIELHIWKLHAPVQPSGRQPSRSGRNKPYYGNFVQPKYNRPDARAIPSGRGLVMEAFSANLERQLQLTVRTLGQVIRTLHCVEKFLFQLYSSGRLSSPSGRLSVIDQSQILSKFR